MKPTRTYLLLAFVVVALISLGGVLHRVLYRNFRVQPAQHTAADTASAKRRFDQIKKQWQAHVKAGTSAEHMSEIAGMYALVKGRLGTDIARHFYAAQGMSVVSFQRGETDKAINYLSEALTLAESQPGFAHPEGSSWASWQVACYALYTTRLTMLQEKGKALLSSDLAAARTQFDSVVLQSRDVKYATAQHAVELAGYRGNSLILTSATYQMEKRFYEALAYLEQARPDYAFCDSAAQCSFHAGKAACYIGLGSSQHQDALKELAYALSIAKQAHLSTLDLSLSALLAQLDPAAPDSPSTMPDHLLAASDSASLTEYRSVLASTRGLLEFASGNDAEAEKIFIKEIASAQNKPWRGVTAACEGSLAEIALRRGNTAAASDHYRVANTILEQENQFPGDGTLVGSVQQVCANLPALYAKVLTVRGKKLEALAVVDRARGLGLLQTTSFRNEVYAGQVSPAAAAEIQRLRQAYREADTAFRANPNDHSFSRRSTAKSAWEKAMADLPHRFPTYAAWIQRQHTRALQSSIASLQDLAHRNPDTLYLHVDTIDSEATLVFALSARCGLQVFPLKTGTDQWNSLVVNWNSSIAAEAEKSNDLTQAMSAQVVAAKEPVQAKALFAALLGPVDAAGLLSKHRRLVIVPDGALWNAPFAALVDTHGRRLIDRMPVSVTVSLRQVAEENKPKGAQTIPFFYVANPPLPENNRDHLQPLAVAAGSAEKIAKKVLGAQGLEGFAAQESKVKERLPDADVIFFATHGFLVKNDGVRAKWGEEANSGLDSYLLLAPDAAQKPARAGDGRLDGRDLLNLTRPLSARMAVLMACSSGEGTPAGGEGLMGLVWSFWGAGCPSVIASGWSVDQEASSQLMENFWDALQSAPPAKAACKDEVLRTAIQKLRAGNKRYSSPYYWAAFQVYGNTEPL